jgi:hypothetical protein
MKKHLIPLFLLLLFSVSLEAQVRQWQWARTAGQNDTDNGHAIATDLQGNSYITGSFRNYDISFDTITLVNADEYDIFIAKYDPAGQVDWAVGAGGLGVDEGFSIAADNAGGIYACGQFASDSITIGGFTLLNTSATGNSDMFIAKLDTGGAVLWARSFGGLYNEGAYAIKTDPNGDVYMTGYFGTETISFDSYTLNNYVVTYPHPFDIYLTKFDPSGNVIWAKSVGGSYGDLGYSLATDNDGAVYLASNTNSDGINYDGTTYMFGGGPLQIILSKYDPAGTQQWVKHINSSGNSQFPNIDVNAGKEIFLSGRFNSSITIGSTTVTCSGTYPDTFIAKLDSLGNGLWLKSTGGVYDDVADAVAADDAGNVYWGGMIKSSPVMFDTIPVSYTGANGIYFLSKYDNAGNALWVKTGGGSGNDRVFDISYNPNGNVYISGNNATDTVLFDTIALYNPGGYLFSNACIAMIGNDAVWPGDTDNNSVVNNDDLLPVGLYYGSIGFPRDTIDNTWQADTCDNWTAYQYNGINMKHADCNGDSIIDANDTLAITLNFGVTHAFAPSASEQKLSSPELYFVPLTSTFNGGDWVELEIWSGSAAMSIPDVYGIAFNISYPSVLVQPGSESIDFSGSWLGTPGTNALSLEKTNSLADLMYAAKVRTDHTNDHGYGKIGKLKFQLKPLVGPADSLALSFNFVHAVTAGGENVPLHASPVALITPVGIEESKTTYEIKVLPNPSAGTFTFYDLEIGGKISIFDIRGTRILEKKAEGASTPVSLQDFSRGIYFYTVYSGKSIRRGKLVLH